MSDFPTSLPSFTNLDGNLTLAANSHAGRHNKVHDEIAAVAAKVGINNSADTSSLDYKAAQAATHASNTSNPHSVTKSQVGLANADNTSDATKLAATLLAVYPVGSIYISVVSTNPGTLFGGTWVAFATGRTLVGIDTGQTEFDTVEETGGAKTHTHGSASATQNGTMEAMVGSALGEANTIAFKESSAYASGQTGTYRVVGASSSSNPSFSHFTRVVGQTAAGSSLPPYIVTYMFRRTA